MKEERNIRDLILDRRSTRKFKDIPVEKEKIELLVEAYMHAPSSCNKRPAEIFVVTKKEALESLKRTTPYGRYRSPLNIVAVANKERLIPEAEEFFLEDVSAAIQNLLLMAESLDLGAVWCGIYPVEKFMERMKKALSLDDKYIPVALLHIGYKDQENQRDIFEYSDKVHYVEEEL